jgi:hypothetical protein
VTEVMNTFVEQTTESLNQITVAAQTEIIIPTLWDWCGYYLSQMSTWGYIIVGAVLCIGFSRWYRKRKGWL